MLAGSSVTFPLEMAQVDTNEGKKKKAGRGRNNEDKSSFKICTQFLKPSEL